MGLIAGTRFGHYEIQSPLGAGGMGEVYRARDTRLNRIVAIKVLPEAFASDADRLRRFQNESHLLSALNHPGLLTIFDVGSDNGRPFLVFEFLEGHTLRDVLNQGALSPRRTLDYSLQLARALAAAHDKGIVHRDLKPENVFITNDDRLKILDFGLAKDVGAASSSDAPTLANATGEGVILGTVGYMAPEQVHGQPADHRSDIFSFGAILYEMLAGQRAFSGRSNVETLNAILTVDPAELTESAQRVGPGLQLIMRRCLEKTPKRRFQSAIDLAFAIEALSGYAGATTAAPSRSGGSMASQWRRSLALAVVALAIGAGGWLAGRGHAPRSSAVSYVRLSLQTHTVFNARFAPDGETVVYSAAPAGNRPELFIHRRDSPEAQRMGVADAELLSVSSKGELALLARAQFIRHRWFRGTLARMDVGGTAPREVLDNVTDADWSRDGSQLAILHIVNGRQRLEFPIGTTVYETSGFLSDLRVSPHGDRIAFMEHPAGVDDRGTVAVVDLHGRKTVLTREFPGEEGLAWAPSGDEIYYSGAADEPLPRLTIQAVDLDGHARTVLEGADYLWLFDVAANGQFVVIEGEEHGHVVGRGPDAAVERDLSWLDQSAFAHVASDGRQMLFTETTFAPNYGLAFRGTDGSAVVRLGDGVACDLSKNGKWALAYLPNAPMQLILYPTGAGDHKLLDRGTIESYTTARLFRDDQRVLVCGREPRHAERCYVQKIAGGPPTAATPEGTSNGVPSPDGSSVVAQSTDGTFAIFPLGGGAARPLPGIGGADSVIDWSADGRSLLVSQYSTIPAPVDRVDLETGRRTRIVELGPADSAGVVILANASFSDDARSYAYSYVRLPTHLALVKGAK